jgi:hypothetical protein
MNVTISIRTTPNKFPGGTVGGDWHLELALASDPGTVTDQYDGASPSANFDLPEGATYNVRGYRQDGTGAPLGGVATDQFTVGDDLVTLDVAESIATATTVPPAARSAKK